MGVLGARRRTRRRKTTSRACPTGLPTFAGTTIRCKGAGLSQPRKQAFKCYTSEQLSPSKMTERTYKKVRNYS